MKKKSKKRERECYPFYDIVRTDERSVIIPKLGEGEEKVRFDSTQAEVYLRHCLEPMIAEAKARIMEQVNDHGFFKDFSACNVRMKEVFVETFSFVLYVERFSKPEGKSHLSIMAIEPEMFPLFESKIVLINDWRDGLLDYIGKDDFCTKLLSMMKQLMVGHRKELERLRG